MGWKKVIVKGWLENCKGGGFGGGRTSRRRTTNRVQGGDDGGRSQGGNRMIQGRSDGGRSQEGLGAGGARQDSGHSHNCGPWWSRRREDLWWSKGWRLQGANRWWRSRWWRSPRRRRRADEPGQHRGSRGPRRSRCSDRGDRGGDPEGRGWWAEGEQRVWQETVVAMVKQQGWQEDSGEGGWVVNSDR